MGFRPDRTAGECGRSPQPHRVGENGVGQLEPQLKGPAYVNHLAADDRPEKVRASFGENYARLRQVKGVYDPTNLFRLNPNVVS
jgi:Berberine and berberine like